MIILLTHSKIIEIFGEKNIKVNNLLFLVFIISFVLIPCLSISKIFFAFSAMIILALFINAITIIYKVIKYSKNKLNRKN